ncbi:MAG: transporter substrate-binding domain-containing protein [Bacteroidales bacterium]|jgi:membrane-bound lytic murein transglycosylase F|nr:transporter substrate-binding domain-containing protein [Bacteroidales bacterium]
MKYSKLKYLGFIALFVVALVFGKCTLSTKEAPDEDNTAVDFPEILNRGELIVGVSTNSTDYFVYRGKPMGFQYEILNKFAKVHDLKLKIIVENDLIKSTDYLKNQDIDIIAQSLTITPERKEIFEFTEPIAQTRQVLVQRKRPINETDSIEFINNQLELEGKTIHIQKGGAAYDRLRNIAEEIAGNIRIVENDSLEMEELIRLVSIGTIDYTVCDENVALINDYFYRNIDISIPVSFPQNLAWAVRKESKALKDSINKWLIEYKETAEYNYLYHKYFKSSRGPQTMASVFYSGKDGKISEYDAVIQEASDMIGWDWRLLASLMFQESRFNPNAVSWAGAFGIMQFMPSTAQSMGINQNSSINEQILAGARYINYLDKLVPESVTSHQDRVKFILAGYNIGFGHVQDAIRLAEKYKQNPNVWDGNVEYFLLHKSNPKFYEDDVVRNGYCTGYQPVNYVNEIVERYEHYRNVIPLS